MRRLGIAAFASAVGSWSLPVPSAAPSTPMMNPGTTTSASATSTLRSYHCTPVALYGRGQGSKGDSRPLSWEEKLSRRTPKSREEKAKMEQIRDEAERFVGQEFRDELEIEFDKFYARANQVTTKITNLVKCIETLDIKLPGAPRPQLVLQMAQIVKASPTELHITPMSPKFVAPITQRIGRFDNSLSPRKEGNKIICTLPPMTTAARDHALEEIKNIKRDLAAKYKLIRSRATRHLQDMELADHLVQSMQRELDDTVAEVEKEKMEQFDELDMLIAEAGLDESDAGVAEGTAAKE